MDTTNTRIGVGTNSPGTDIHVAKAATVRGKFQHTNGATAEIIGASSRGIIRTSGSGKYLDIETNNGTKVATAWTPDDANASGFKVYNKLDAAGGISCDGDINANNNIKAAGQIYSEAAGLGSSVVPNMNDGNVHIVDLGASVTTFTTSNPYGEKPGAMYSFVYDNRGASNTQVTLVFGGQYRFANGIEPNIVRANSTLVVSAVCLADAWLLCTWAEDFS